MKLRVKFTKYGALRFIGHLDVMRFFQKTIRRAEIDVAYSAGFSPHQIMTFAAPLGVGLQSNGEYMDIEVHSIESCKAVMDALNAASVPEIQVVSVKVLPEKAENAMASVFSAEYTVSFREGRKPDVDFEKAVNEYLSKDSIILHKTTKKGTRDMDLKPGIYKLGWNPDSESFHMLLDASSSNNIKPIQIIETMLADYDQILMENALLIMREDVYTNTGTEENPVHTSLGDIGSDE